MLKEGVDRLRQKHARSVLREHDAVGAETDGTAHASDEVADHPGGWTKETKAPLAERDLGDVETVGLDAVAVEDGGQEPSLNVVNIPGGWGAPLEPLVVIAVIGLENGDQWQEMGNLHYGALAEEAQGQLAVGEEGEDADAVLEDASTDVRQEVEAVGGRAEGGAEHAKACGDLGRQSDC